MNTDKDDYAMLEGGDAPAKPKTAKQKVRAKAEAAERKNQRGVAKPRPDKEPIDQPPVMNAKQYETVMALAQKKDDAFTSEQLCKKVTGKDDKTSRETFTKTVVSPLVKAGVLTKTADDDKRVVYTLAKTVINCGGKNFAALLATVPAGKDNAVSCAFIGGKAWAGTMPEGKRDLWKNVRYGRAAGAMLKRLAALGLVGVRQTRAESAKRYWRTA